MKTTREARDDGFRQLWQTRSDVLLACGVSERVAETIYSQGFIDGAGFQLDAVVERFGVEIPAGEAS